MAIDFKGHQYPKSVILCAAFAQAQKKPAAMAWWMNETSLKVRGKWTYLYRAVGRDGQTLDFILSERRDTAAARRFFKRSVGPNGVPQRIAINSIVEQVHRFIKKITRPILGFRVFYSAAATLEGIKAAHMIRTG